MSHRIKSIAIVTILLFLAAGSAVSQEPDRITASGSASVFKEPDTIFITVFMSGRAEEYFEALKKLEEKTAALRKATEAELKDGESMEVLSVQTEVATPYTSVYSQGADVVPLTNLSHRIRFSLKPKGADPSKLISTAKANGAVLKHGPDYSYNEASGSIVYALVNYEAAYNEAEALALKKTEESALRVAALSKRKISPLASSITCGKADACSYQLGLSGGSRLPTPFVSTLPGKIEIKASITASYNMIK